MGDELTGRVATFSTGILKGSETIEQAIAGMKKMMGEKTTAERVGGGVGMAAGGFAGMKAGAALGAFAGPLGALAGGAIGGAAGAFGGDKLGEWIGSKLPKFGDGGIIESPTAAMIGEAGEKEAVIPLPNGKSVPLDLDLSSITRALGDVASLAMKATPMGMAASAVKGMFNSSSGSDASNDMAQQHLSVLQEIKDTLSASRDLQQQYVYNTYN
jgi:hypothetical protein